jgi:hypothetical protein
MEKIAYLVLLPLAVGVFFLIVNYSQNQASLLSGAPSILTIGGAAGIFLSIWL